MLNKIRKDRVKSSILITLASFIAAMIIWPLFDFLWARIFTHSEFVYAVENYALETTIFAIIFGVITYITWKPETKLEKKAKKK